MTLDPRLEYYQDLAFDYAVPLSIVLDLAGLLGPEEDYDGLVSAIQDYADMYNTEYFNDPQQRKNSS